MEKISVEGFWGPVTSSVDWCEENYTHNRYIAEFWNTVSSLAMMVIGIAGLILHTQPLGWRLSFGYLLIVVVGIGSVLFHATLQYEYQMWDELPMVWTACYLFWLLLNEFGYNGKLYTSGVALHCAIATYLTSQSKGTTQFYMFQTSFGVVMWSCFWFVWKLYKGAQDKEIKQLFHKGAIFLFLAISVWLFDKNMCFVYDYAPNPQLHAWWHVLVSWGWMLRCIAGGSGFDLHVYFSFKEVKVSIGFSLAIISDVCQSPLFLRGMRFRDAFAQG